MAMGDCKHCGHVHDAPVHDLTPLGLWRWAGGNDDSISPDERRARYRQLLEKHGLLVPRCDFISEGTRRRCTKEANHEGGHNLDNTDIFGHRRD